MTDSQIALAGITLLAAIVNGALGYGFSSITVPVALLFLANRVLNPALVLIEVALNAYVLWNNRDAFAGVWRRVSPMIVGLVPGIAIGTAVLAQVDPGWLRFVTFVTLLPLILVQAAGYRRPIRSERSASFVFGGGLGVLYAVTTISGPPLAIMLNNQGLAKKDFRAALGVVRLAESSMTAVAYAYVGLYSSTSLALIPWIVPSIAIGVPIGAFIIQRVRAETFRRICMSFDAWVVAFGLSRLLQELSLVESDAAYLVLVGVGALDIWLLYRFFRGPRAQASGSGLSKAQGLSQLRRKTGLSPWAYNESSRFKSIAARIDLQLAVGTLNETITVTADAPVLETEACHPRTHVDERRIADLPLNGRTFIGLVALAPGVALPPGSPLPRINGGRPRVNEYLYDGISVLQPEPGQVGFFPVIDAIQDFKIESNSPPAEFGRFNGGVINLATKSGSNAFRGTAFDFLRHEALNARNLFAAAGASKPRFRRQQFGGVFGGPLRRDRSFFFVDYQGQRQTIGRTVISTVPTILQRQGIFTEAVGSRVPIIHNPMTMTWGPDGSASRTPFPDNRIPVERFDPVARALLERYPHPTSAGTANNYRRDGDEVSDQDQFDLRIDHRVTAGDQAFARVSHFRERFAPVSPLPDGSGAATGTLGPQRTKAWAVASNYQHTFSSRLLNDLRAGDTRRRVSRSAATLPGAASTVLGLAGIPSNAQFIDTLPTFFISGYQHLGSPPNTASAFETSVTHVVDALTWVRGAHALKLGFVFRWERLNVIQPPSPTGYFQFTSLFTDLPGAPDTGSPLASFLLGHVDAFSIDLQRGEIRNRAHVQEYFVQDDWRVSDRLTVNAGLRYTLNFPSVEEDNQAAVFNLETRKLEYLGRDGNPRSARRLHKRNFAPRLGIVARVNDATVVRGGYGLVWIEQAGITTPFTTPVFPFLHTVSQRTLDGVTPAFDLKDGPSVAPLDLTPDAGLGHGVFAVNRDLGSGYVQQWNVSWQRALGQNTSVEVAYIGSHIARAGVPDTNLNQLRVDQLSLGPRLLERVPNPHFGLVPRSSSLGDATIPLAQLMKPYPQHTTVSLYRNNVGTTSYHGIEARIDRRLSRGLSFHASYTRSRLIDDASSVFDASILTGPVVNYPVADSFNRRLERDYSTGDIPHVLVASGIWDLPSGRGRRIRGSRLAGAILNDWTVTGVIRLQSGTPVAVTQSTNFNAFAGFGTQRPNLIGDPELPADERSVSRWFNTSAFAIAPRFTIGSSSRNPVRGPGYRNVDVALIRRVPFRSGTALEVRAEIFNAFNTPALGNPNGVFGTAAFGTITSAGDPRVVQLAVKFHF